MNCSFHTSFELVLQDSSRLYTRKMNFGTSWAMVGSDLLLMYNSTVIRLEEGSAGWGGTTAFDKGAKKRPDAALALEWLGPHSLSAGFRSGDIELYDSRSKGHKTRLQHLSSVIAIKRGEHESQLVAAGLKNTMCLYDLRMIHNYSGTK